jgi:hypothetical protein
MKYLWTPIVWFLVILVLCATPGKDIPHISFLELLAFDKWVHAGIFFILVLLMIRGFRMQRSGWIFDHAVIFTLVFSISYGGILELLQGAVFEDRSADVYDFIANTFGAIVGVMLYRKLSAKIKFLQVP